MRKSRFNFLSVLGVLLLVLGVTLVCVEQNSANAADTPSYVPADKIGKVVVVRDMTQASNCKTSRGENCVEGSVLGTFHVSESEAQANGEEFVKFSGDTVKGKAETKKLFANLSAKFAAKYSKQKAVSRGVSPMSCGYGNSDGGSFTAFNFSSPQPVIGYTVDYNVTFGSSSCNQLTVIGAQTRFVTSGSSAYFGGATLNSGAGYATSCPVNIPNYSSFTLRGSTADLYGHFVESGCAFWDHTASGYVYLY